MSQIQRCQDTKPAQSKKRISFYIQRLVSHDNYSAKSLYSRTNWHTWIVDSADQLIKNHIFNTEVATYFTNSFALLLPGIVGKCLQIINNNGKGLKSLIYVCWMRGMPCQGEKNKHANAQRTYSRTDFSLTEGCSL